VAARQISPERLNCGALAQKVARSHPGLLPQEKWQKKSVARPHAAALSGGQLGRLGQEFVLDKSFIISVRTRGGHEPVKAESRHVFKTHGGSVFEFNEQFS